MHCTTVINVANCEFNTKNTSFNKTGLSPVGYLAKYSFCRKENSLKENSHSIVIYRNNFKHQSKFTINNNN